jgi:predicted transposase YbfD/YdcC
MIIPLLDGLSLDGGVITADALHTQRATADYVHGRSADFILPAKDDQPGLVPCQKSHVGSELVFSAIVRLLSGTR